MSSSTPGKGAEALLLEAINKLSSEVLSIQGILAAQSAGLSGKGHGSTHGAHEAHVHAHAESHDAAHGLGHGHADGHGHFSLAAMVLPIFHIVIDSLNIIGVFVMFVSLLAVLPTLFLTVLPAMFASSDDEEIIGRGHRQQLHVRMTMSKGIMLGLDLMVGADIIETLIGNSDIFKVTKPSLNP
jgi:uncharacterized membrane protein